MNILIPVLLVMAIGLVLAVILTIASKVFYVPVDETVANLRSELPGANCGACGFAGCDDYAAALGNDPSIGTAKCPVGGADLASKLAGVLGVEAESAEPVVAATQERQRALWNIRDIQPARLRSRCLAVSMYAHTDVLALVTARLYALTAQSAYAMVLRL